jgi:hypothetical protein
MHLNGRGQIDVNGSRFSDLKSAFLKEILRILKTLPRLDLVRVQLLDIGAAGTCTMLGSLQLQPIFFPHLYEARPHPLVLLSQADLALVLLCPFIVTL